MVSELEKIRELEDKLLKVRLEITEKEQEKTEKVKAADVAHSVTGFAFGCGILCLFLENKLISIILFSIGFLSLVFWSAPKASKISKLIREIDKSKKKKKRLESEIKGLEYLARVKAKKEVI